MALTKVHQATFRTLRRAFANDQVALVECTIKATGEQVPVVCAISPGFYAIVPLAQLFAGNPYDLLEVPTPKLLRGAR
jgi:hypothetical protein